MIAAELNAVKNELHNARGAAIGWEESSKQWEKSSKEWEKSSKHLEEKTSKYTTMCKEVKSLVDRGSFGKSTAAAVLPGVNVATTSTIARTKFTSAHARAAAVTKPNKNAATRMKPVEFITRKEAEPAPISGKESSDMFASQ